MVMHFMHTPKLRRSSLVYSTCAQEGHLSRYHPGFEACRLRRLQRDGFGAFFLVNQLILEAAPRGLY